MHNESHGATKNGKWTKTYRIWHNMKQRCFNKNNQDYATYAGRGITICDRWRNSFQSFLSDMGECPQGMSIDRIDNDGNYEPGNCRWATQKMQMNNYSKNVYISYKGEKLHISVWAKRIGMSTETLQNRYNYGWSTERMMTQPLKKWRRFK